jgi:hypothetical protein
MTTNPSLGNGPGRPRRTERATDALLVAIVLAVGLMAGAASFHHVHDWTMHNSPHGTASWYGWANAVITELIPTAALIIIARKRRNGVKVGILSYPMFLLVTAVGLSLTAQLAVAVPTIFGWMVSALPACAFFALSKLVFTTTKTTHTNADSTAEDTTTNPAPSSTVDSPTGGHVVTGTTDRTNSVPAPVTPIGPAPLPTHLLSGARFAITNHQATTGQPITRDQLAARMSITPDMAGQLLTALADHPTPDPTPSLTVAPAMPAMAGSSPIRVNGTPVREAMRS